MALDLQPIQDNSTPPMSMAPNQPTPAVASPQSPGNAGGLDLQPINNSGLDLQPIDNTPDSVLKRFNNGDTDPSLDYAAAHPFKTVLQPASQTIMGQSAEQMTNDQTQKDAANADFKGMNADEIQNKLADIHDAAFKGSVGAQIADTLQTPGTYLAEPLLKGAGALAGKIPVAGTTLGDIASKVQLKNPLTAEGWHDMVNQVQQLSGKNLDDTINQTINEGINRGIRPSVSGKQTPQKAAQFDSNATAAIKDLVTNKDNVDIQDKDGNPVELNEGGVHGLVQGVQQRMNQLVQDWQGLATKTDQAGVKIDATPYITKLNDLMGDTGEVDEDGNPILTKEGQIFQTEHPADFNKVETIRDGLQLRGEFTPSDLLDKIQEWNADLAPKYKGGFQYGSTRAINVVRDLTSDMRSDLDDAITSSTGEEFQPLRTMWGSYKSLLKDVVNRDRVAGRANPKGIWNLLDSAGNAEMFSGAYHTLTGNPLVGIPTMLKGGVLKISKNLIEKANNPNEIVNNMLGQTDKLLTKKAALDAWAVKNKVPTLDPEVMGGQGIAYQPKVGIDRGLPSPQDAGTSSGPTINQEGYVPPQLTYKPKVGINRALPSPQDAGTSDASIIAPEAQPGQVSEPLKALPKPETTYGEGFTMRNYKPQPLKMSDSDRKDLADMLDWTHHQQKGERYSYINNEGQREFGGTKSAHAESVQENGPQASIHMMQKALLDKPLTPMQTLKVNKMLKDFQTNIKPKMNAETPAPEGEVEGNTDNPQEQKPLGPDLGGNKGSANTAALNPVVAIGTTATAGLATGNALAKNAKAAITSPTQASSKEDQNRMSLPAPQYTKREEGFRGSIYKDTAGHNTVGYGFNVDDPAIRRMVSNDVLSGKRELSTREADNIFTRAYSKAQDDATRFVGASTWDKLSSNQKKALSDLSYNLGYKKLSGFNSMRMALRSGDWNEAAHQLMVDKTGNNPSHYAQEVPNRARRNVQLLESYG